MQRFPWNLMLLSASSASVVAAPEQTIYGAVQLYTEASGFHYQIGTFDLANPTGTLGTYSYVWNNLGASTTDALANISRSPLSAQLFIQGGFDSLTAIASNGGLSISLNGIPTYYGMAFGSTGTLYGIGGSDNNFDVIDTVSGDILSSLPLAPFMYSQFGGGLTATVGNNIYFANFNFEVPDNPAGAGELYALNPDSPTLVSYVGAFTGTNFSVDDWMTLFAYDANLYLLNSNRLYSVNQTDASLILLGAINSLPVGFERGFSGAVGNVMNSPVPEPSTYGIILAGLALAAAAQRRLRTKRLAQS
jgi:hypothetical protein